MTVPTVTTHADRNLRIATAGVAAIALAWPLSPVHPPSVCPLRNVTGIPCPMCGMTRVCVALAHGHLGTALTFNPGVVLVVILAVVALVRPAAILRARPPAWMFGVVLGALWIWNLGFNPKL